MYGPHEFQNNVPHNEMYTAEPLVTVMLKLLLLFFGGGGQYRFLKKKIKLQESLVECLIKFGKPMKLVNAIKNNVNEAKCKSL